MMRPPALRAQVRQHGADELDRPDEVRGDDVVDLFIGELLGGTEEAVARVAHDHLDASELGEAPVHDVADRRGIGHV
jgi:hypothetical protein